MAQARTAATEQPVFAWVAVGANLGDARRTVQRAFEALGSLPRTRLVRQSSLYRTEPQEAAGPDFVNAVALLETGLDPYALLAALQAIEQSEGRERPYRNAPRTLDIDLLMHGESRLDTPTLALPHPRMPQRAFVLVPLAEISPEKVGAEQLLAVRGQRIERL